MKPNDGSKGYGGSFGSSYLFRPFSKRISRILLNTPVSPMQVTLFGFILGMAGIVLLFSQNFWAVLFGCTLIYLQHVFDCVDGELARLRGEISKAGALTDEVSDRVFENALFLVATFVAYRQIQEVWVWPVGMLAVIGNARMVTLYLKLEGLQYKGQSIRTLPFWRQMLNYGGELNLVLIVLGALYGKMVLALVLVAITSNVFATGRFFYATLKLGREERKK